MKKKAKKGGEGERMRGEKERERDTERKTEREKERDSIS